MRAVSGLARGSGSGSGMLARLSSAGLCIRATPASAALPLPLPLPVRLPFPVSILRARPLPVPQLGPATVGGMFRHYSSTGSGGGPSAPPTRPPGQGQGQGLSEDIATLPNVLTISRLLMTPYIGHLVLTHELRSACAFLFVAAVTDLLDGWIARRTGKYTVFGSIADPAADKALMTTMVVTLGLSGMMPLPLMALILGRDAALVVSAFVIRFRTLQPPRTLARYFNPRLPSATVTPTQISKINTFLQLLLVGALTIFPVLFPPPEQGQPQPQPQPESQARVYASKTITAFMYIVAATTVWSGLGYLGGAGSARVLARKLPTNTK